MIRASLFLIVAVATISIAAQPKQSPADKAIDDAAKLLEKALADAKTPEDRAKLQGALAAIRKAGKGSPIPQNDLISDIVDNRGKYVGKTLTLRMVFEVTSPVSPLNLRAGQGDGYSAIFVATDPKNGAKLAVRVALPKDIEIPAAKPGEEVVVTFTVDTEKKNTAISIVRP